MKSKVLAGIKVFGLTAIMLLGLISIIGTGGGGGGGVAPPGTSSAAGLWHGTLTDGNNNTYIIGGVISTDGQLRFIVDEGLCSGTQYSGTFLLDGDTGSGNFTGYTSEECLFDNGTQLTSGTFDFTATGDNVTGTYSAEGDLGTFNLTNDPVAEEPITLADLEGNWGYDLGPDNFVFITVFSDGSLTGTDDSGCNYSGQISIIDPNFSITNVSLTASSCNDPAFNGTYSGLGILVFDATGDEFVVLLSNSTISVFDVFERQSLILRAELPCTGAGPDAISCQTNTSDSDSVDFGATPGASYDVTIRVRGVVEQKTYIGSSEVDGTWAAGGTPGGDTFNIYKLYISSPEQTYFLNYGDSFIGNCFAVDVQKTVTVDTGAIVELSADAGGDLFQILNQDIGATPIVIPGVPPAPNAFDGQFIQLDVISVVKQ